MPEPITTTITSIGLKAVISTGFSFAKKEAIKAYQHYFGELVKIDKNLGGELQKAARKAQLSATILACESCLSELSSKNKQQITWLKKLIQSFQERIEELNKESVQTLVSDTDSLNLFQPESSNAEEFQQKLIKKLQEETFGLIRTGTNLKFFDESAFNLLKRKIENGWEKDTAPHLPTVNCDWFELVCGYFNHEYNSNPRLTSEIQKYQNNQIITQLNLIVGNLHHLKEILDINLKHFSLSQQIDEKLVETQTLFQESQKVSDERHEEIIEKLEEIKSNKLSEQTTTTKIDSIPNLLPSAYGVFDRKDECNRLGDLLKDLESRLIVIHSPSGYGKTKLISKFLQQIAPNSKLKNDASLNGILYISCENRTTNDVWNEVLSKVGLMLGRSEEFGKNLRQITTSREQALYIIKEINSGGEILLVLDNFEDLLNKRDLSIGEDFNDPLRTFFQIILTLANSHHIIITTQRVPNFIGKNAPILSERFQLSLSGTPVDDAIQYLKEEGQNYGLQEIDEAVLRDFVNRIDCLPLALVSFIRHLRKKPKRKITTKELMISAKSFEEYVKFDKENGQRLWLTEQLLELSVEERLILSVLSAFRKPCPPIALEFMLPQFSSQKIEEITAQLERDLLIYQEGEGYQLSAIIRECAYNLIPEKKDDGN